MWRPQSGKNRKKGWSISRVAGTEQEDKTAPELAGTETESKAGPELAGTE